MGDAMATLAELLAHGSRNTRLDADATLLREQTREIERFLDILAIDIAVEHDRHMTHGLVGPAHDAEGQVDLALFANHGRDDGVERQLPRPDAIGMAWFRHEIGAAILQDDAALGRRDA